MRIKRSSVRNSAHGAMRGWRFRAAGAVTCLAAMVLCCPLGAQQAPPADLANQSLENLMTMRVTSVSKEEQKVSQTAAAVFVITQEDIRRSGHTTIPDLLRMVPGLDVAQVDTNIWAVGARGLNGRFSNKLLVTIDGRSLYTPTYGGTFWDVLDTPLEDIARIEVIRGPGGTVWGANAVDGVVNIITLAAAKTHGLTAVAGSGNVNDEFGTLQYGGAAGKSADYRVYGKYLNEDGLRTATGTNARDGWHVLRGGFRVDSNVSPKDVLTTQGDLYTGLEGLSSRSIASVTSTALENRHQVVEISGGFVQLAWNHTMLSGSGFTLQASYDRYVRKDNLGDSRGTVNIGFQDHFTWEERQKIVWGLNYRDSDSRTAGSFPITLDPANLNTQLLAGFVQDEIQLIPGRLYFTAGTKIERNHYTGWGAMPSVRAAWMLSANQTLWAAISDVIRSPAATDASIRTNVGGFTTAEGLPALISTFGNPNAVDEKLLSYELGYRTAVGRRLSLDVATYNNKYSNLATTESGTPILEASPSPLHLLVPLTRSDLMFGETRGLELSIQWKALDRWTLSPGLALEEIHMHTQPSSQDTASPAISSGSGPRQSAQVRSHVALPRNFSWDVSAYFVGRLRGLGVPSYTRVDSGLTWQASEHLWFSVVGQNLVQNEHLEFFDTTLSSVASLMKRSAYAKLAWVF